MIDYSRYTDGLLVQIHSQVNDFILCFRDLLLTNLELSICLLVFINWQVKRSSACLPVSCNLHRRLGLASSC